MKDVDITVYHELEKQMKFVFHVFSCLGILSLGLAVYLHAGIVNAIFSACGLIVFLIVSRSLLDHPR